MSLEMKGTLAFLCGCLLLLLAARLFLPRPRRQWWRLARYLPATISLVLGLAGATAGGYALWFTHRSPPPAEERPLFRGVTFRRVVLKSPRPIVMSILRVDLREPGTSVLVSGPLPNGILPGRTTTQFLRESGAQAAINGNLFRPFYYKPPLTYYPHAGDPVSVSGAAASRGNHYSTEVGPATMFISADNHVSFDKPIGPVYNAVSGTGTLVRYGKPAVTGDSGNAGRAAAGADKSGRILFLVTIDGKQPGYSEGIFMQEYANLLPQYCPGIETAIVLDGGGSTTMAATDLRGKPILLNSPVNAGIVGWERVVANHVGIFARPL